MTTFDNMKEYVAAGGAAAMIARTTIAPVERVKIVYQTRPELSGWKGVVKDLYNVQGVLSFWRGNTAACVRVVPYLSVQLSSNEIYRKIIPIDQRMSREAVAGLLAGITSVITTYPLDTVRARLAVQTCITDGKAAESITSMARKIIAAEGFRALYNGCYMSCFGGGVYHAIKFSTYGELKDMYRNRFNIIDDKDLGILQRALSGAFGGFIAQTFCYPMDVVRRRMQINKSGKPPYTGVVNAITTIAKTEGISTGLFRGLSLNYAKTIPNVAIYLSLYDYFKYWLTQCN